MTGRPTSLAILLLLIALTASAQVVTLVDLASDATDPNNENDAEPSIAVNPLNPLEIAVVAFSGNWDLANAPAWKSADGGMHWTKMQILPPPDRLSTSPGDQKIVYDSAGTLFFVEMTDHTDRPRCYFYRPGTTTVAPYVPGPAFGDDQPMLETRGADLVSVWADRYRRKSPARTMATIGDKNGGPISVVPVGPSNRDNRTARIAVAPGGNLYVILKTEDGSVSSRKDPDAIHFQKATFRVIRSINGGRSWNTPGTPVHKKQAVTWFTSDWGDPKSNGQVGRARSSDAWIATHPITGEVWVVYCDRDPATRLGQIFATHSSDNATTWAPPVRVTDGTRHSAFPEIAVAANGAIGVLYMDYDATGVRTVYAHRLARSFNDGTSWSQTELQTFETQNLTNGIDHGLWLDYAGLAVAGNSFAGVFCGQSLNRFPPQFDPIFFKVAATP